MRSLILGAGLFLSALVTGCSSVPQLSSLSKLNPFSSKEKGDQPAPLVELKGTMAVRTAWKLDIGKAGAFTFSPALAGNTVVVASNGGDIARVEAATGKLMWRIKAGTEPQHGQVSFAMASSPTPPAPITSPPTARAPLARLTRFRLPAHVRLERCRIEIV